MKKILQLALALSIASTCSPSDKNIDWSPGWTSNPTANMKIVGPEAMMLPRDWVVTGKGGMVSSANALASRAGVEILKKGGTAIDALLAVQWVLNVVEPQSSGIGGGAFLIYYDAKTKKVHAIDGREEAPKNSTERMFLSPDGKPIRFYPDRVSGGLPVGIPGTLAMMHYSHKKFSHSIISFSQTFQKAIDYAKNGFRVSPRLSLSIKANLSRLKRQPAAKKIFLRNNREYRPGEILYQIDLAHTLSLIAKKGINVFYNGAVGEDLIDTVKNNPVRSALITASDLLDYRVVERKPVWADFKGHRIYTMPPPSSSISMLQALKILNHYPTKNLSMDTDLGIHLKLESEKLAFADRAVWLGDPDFSTINHNALLQTDYIQRLKGYISKSKALESPRNQANPKGIHSVTKTNPITHKEGKNTTHISVIDKWGNVASCTSTIEMGFGSALVVKNRGFLLNNELTDFNPEPNTTNSITGKRVERRTALNPSAKETKGGKRPRSSMTPVIVFKNNKPVYILGSPGGSRIPGIVSSVLLRLIIEKLDMQQAINAPRALHRNNKSADLEYMYVQKKIILDKLKKRGHTIRPVSKYNRVYGGVNGIRVGKNNILWGGSDTRREGSAIAVEENE